MEAGCDAVSHIVCASRCSSIATITNIVVYVLLLSSSAWFQCIDAIEITDFVATNVLPDGEVETRIHFKGVTAKETAVFKGYRSGMKYRQLTDGKHFIQLIYDGDENLRDCEYLHAREEVIRFVGAFRDELRRLVDMQNLTVTSLDDVASQLNAEEHGWFHYETLRDLCRKRHRELKRVLHDERHNRNASVIANESNPGRSHAKRSLFILPGTMWCGLSDSAYRYTHLGGMQRTDKCCRTHDHCKNNILPNEKKYNYYNHGPFTVSHCFCDNRWKRDLSDLLRVPGTRWCGKGYSASKFTDLGGFSGTDKCCRVHDKYCPFWIGGFETKYGLFNWRVNTLMHCGCDERQLQTSQEGDLRIESESSHTHCMGYVYDVELRDRWLFGKSCLLEWHSIWSSAVVIFAQLLIH